MTEKYRKLKWLFFALSIACTLIPVLVFFFIGVCNGEIGPARKFGLSIAFVFAVAISVFGLIRKFHYRCGMWVFILACYLAIERFAPILITFGLCCCLDELIITPLYRRYKNLVMINKEIDKREEAKGE